jgi:hypothetical protein
MEQPFLRGSRLTIARRRHHTQLSRFATPPGK